MKNSFLLSLVAIGISLVSCFSAESAEKERAPEFLVGAATADVTPKNGVSMDGAISKPGPAKGVHDPLTARAIVLKSGGTTIALAIVDMCMIEKSVYDKAKEIVQEKNYRLELRGETLRWLIRVFDRSLKSIMC